MENIINIHIQCTLEESGVGMKFKSTSHDPLENLMVLSMAQISLVKDIKKGVEKMVEEIKN